MVKKLAIALGLVAAWMVEPNCPAAVMVSLTSPNANLGGLMPGQTATFDVEVSNILANAPAGLDFLSVTVQFGAGELGTPTSFALGPIIPIANPGIVTGPGGAAGSADATYDGSFGTFDPIATDGVFFSFDVTAQAVASTSTTEVLLFSVDMFDPANNVIPYDLGAPIQVTVLASTGAVPEPSSWLAFLGLFGAAGFLPRWSRRICGSQPGGRR